METLSDKIVTFGSRTDSQGDIRVKDIKNFIIQIKSKLCFCESMDRTSDIKCKPCRILNELSGDALLGS